jgi:hypothetical protein
LKNKLKKIILVLNISLIRIFNTFIGFFFLKTLLLHHIDEGAMAFLQLFSIEDLSEGRIFFLLIFCVLIFVIYLLKKFIYFYNSPNKPVEKSLVLNSLLLEALVLYMVIILYYENYLIHIILSKIFLITIDRYIYKLKRGLFVKGGLIVCTIFTFSYQLFADNLFYIIVLFLFLRSMLRNLSMLIENFEKTKSINFNQLIK